MVVKISDFGLAKEINTSRERDTDYVATRWYRAPELLMQSKTYGEKVDIFAMGCVTVELLSGIPLAAGTNEIDQLAKLASLLGKPPESWKEGYTLAANIGFKFADDQASVTLGRAIPNASQLLLDLILKMLRWDPKQRLSASECL